MLARPQIPPELLAVCNRWSEILEKLREEKEHIEYIQNELPAVLRNRNLFIQLLRNIVKGSRYPDIRQAQMFEDEILLYLNPKPIFSIRLFIYEPGDYTPIHRVYIHRFDLEQNSVQRMYSPRVKKKLLAAETLKIFGK